MMHRIAWVITATAFAAGVVADLFVGVGYFPGYAATIGLVGCAVIIIVSKWLGAALIQRDEDYWPNDGPADLQEDLRG